MHVLVVEDDLPVSVVVSELLARHAHDVTICHDGETAWDAYRAQTYPLILVDWGLPGQVDGLELCRRIRAYPNAIPPVVLVMTGRGRSEDLAAALAAGADDYLVKPFDAGQFDMRLAIAEQRVNDRAARRDAEEVRSETEERFQTIWNASSDAMAVSDAAGTVLAANPAYCTLYGYAAEELVGHNFSVIFPESLRSWAIEEYNATFHSPTATPEYEARIRRADGTERIVESRINFLHRNGQRVAMLSTIRDITGRVEAREALEQSDVRHRLLASILEAFAEAGYELPVACARVAQELAESVGDACVIRLSVMHGQANPLTTFWHRDPTANGVLQELLPLASVALTGLDRHMTETARPVMLPRPSDDDLRNGLPKEFQNFLIRFPVSNVLIVPIRGRDHAVGALAIARDGSGREFTHADQAIAEQVADRVGLAIDNARLYANAQESLLLRNQVLSTVSHDLKNPLAAIIAGAQALELSLTRGHEPSNEQVASSLRRISNQARSMASQLNELLDVASLEAGQPLELHRQPTDIVALARELIAEELQSVSGFDIKLVAEVDELVGDWDRFRLERVVRNLLSNAVKFSPERGTITVRVSRDDQTAPPSTVLSVRDEGIGIPARDLAAVFERFSRGSNVTGQIRGTGLGLAGVRQTVEQHGGRVAIESEEGIGTLVVVRLPMAAVIPSPRPG
jgi:PAS domain S-box-containing protein